MPNTGQEFKDYLQDRLQHSNSTNFLLVGEDHRNSSALIALAHNAEAIEKAIKEGRKVVILTEDLPEKLNWLWQVVDYKKKDLEAMSKTLGTDAQAALKLVDSGVIFYGLENSKTAPNLYLKGTTKAAIFDSAVQLIPGIFKKNNGTLDVERTAYIKELRDNPDLDVEDFKNILGNLYAASNDRISVCNEVITSKLVQISIDVRTKDALIIFAGGNAHLTMATQDNTMVSPGVAADVKQKVPDGTVDFCSVNSKSYPEGYRATDIQVKLNPIPDCFQTANEFPSSSSSAKQLARLGSPKIPVAKENVLIHDKETDVDQKIKETPEVTVPVQPNPVEINDDEQESTFKP